LIAKSQTTIANKIKKWVQTALLLSNNYTGFAIPITRLTSIKSLCSDTIAARKFALYLSKRVLQQAVSAPCPDNINFEEWDIHKSLMTDAIADMERFLEHPTPFNNRFLWSYIQQINTLQGDDYRHVYSTRVRFVKSDYLLKLEYALRCFVGPDIADCGYRLAKEYTECYVPKYGTGLTPESVPMLLEIAEFWCQYYFEKSLQDKFPQLMKLE
jgi:hypothetical protein